MVNLNSFGILGLCGVVVVYTRVDLYERVRAYDNFPVCEHVCVREVEIVFLIVTLTIWKRGGKLWIDLCWPCVL